MNRRDVLRFAMALGSGALGTARAQEPFPNRLMKIVVPYPPGGITDQLGRVMADILGKAFPAKPVIVENKGGGTGTVAQQYVLQQPHDGHALLSGGLGGLILPTILNPSLPINPQENLIPVAQLAELMNVLVVGSNVEARTLSELIAYGKTRVGQLNYGSNGVGTLAHFTSVLFNQRAGTHFAHIPYRSSGEIITGLKNGDIQISFANLPAVAALIRAGSLRAIAVTGSRRAQALPDVPTMQELGMADFVATGWLGAYAAVGTPQANIDKLSDALVQGGKQLENIQRLQSAGFEVQVRDHADFAAWNRSEFVRWNELARKENIKPEA
jgi:tripartite-type tricarboxylate transporter receptor subunit TctC